MGNYVSCTLAAAAAGRTTEAAKVILPSGELRQFKEPTIAAELMLEISNHFLVNSRSLQIGRRFFPLAADEELEMGNVYVMFPMRKASSVITPGDMGTFLIFANSVMKRASGGKARILPELAGLSQVSPEEEITWQSDGGRVNMNNMDEGIVGEGRNMMSMCRSRRPMLVLEPIAEEAVSCI